MERNGEIPTYSGEPCEIYVTQAALYFEYYSKTKQIGHCQVLKQALMIALQLGHTTAEIPRSLYDEVCQLKFWQAISFVREDDVGP